MVITKPESGPAVTSGATGSSAVGPMAGLSLFDRLYIHRPQPWVAAILLAYLLVAVHYAVQTPSWQAPDEPAHFNYVAHIAQTGELPVLRMGDYDQYQLNRLLNSRFAIKFPPSVLRYESYQPPLFYISAVPIYWLSDGSLLALRLYNIVLGAIALYLLFLCLATVFPDKPMIAVGAVAFAAMLPMHVAITASLTNDVLAQLLLMAALLALLRWMRLHFYAARSPVETRPHYLSLIMLGLLLGLGMVTKVYAYIVLPIALAAVVLVIWLRPRVGRPLRLRPLHWQSIRPALMGALLVLGPSLLLPLPMWLRNIALYGRWDFLGMRWHDEVVIGQLRTSEFIDTFGWVAYAERAFGFTFKSFWGVFGWMGVFMDERIYTALLLFTGILFLGLLWALVRLIAGPPDTEMDLFQVSVQVLLGLFVLAVALSYIWYNLKFVQHQGRYFFWGLLPISGIVALAWRELMHPIQGAITGFMTLVLAVSIAITGFLAGDIDNWTVLTITLLALLLMLQPLLTGALGERMIARLPARLQDWTRGPMLTFLRRAVWLSPFLLLFALNLAAPVLFIVPQLGR